LAQPRSRHAATLPEIETDTNIRPLAQATLDIILAQPTTTNPYVFPVRVDGKSLQGLPRMWDAMREK
jgi:hypothetical protein